MLAERKFFSLFVTSRFTVDTMEMIRIQVVLVGGTFAAYSNEMIFRIGPIEDLLALDPCLQDLGVNAQRIA